MSTRMCTGCRWWICIQSPDCIDFRFWFCSRYRTRKLARRRALCNGKNK